MTIVRGRARALVWVEKDLPDGRRRRGSRGIDRLNPAQIRTRQTARGPMSLRVGRGTRVQRLLLDTKLRVILDSGSATGSRPEPTRLKGPLRPLEIAPLALPTPHLTAKLGRYVQGARDTWRDLPAWAREMLSIGAIGLGLSFLLGAQHAPFASMAMVYPFGLLHRPKLSLPLQLLFASPESLVDEIEQGRDQIVRGSSPDTAAGASIPNQEIETLASEIRGRLERYERFSARFPRGLGLGALLAFRECYTTVAEVSDAIFVDSSAPLQHFLPRLEVIQSHLDRMNRLFLALYVRQLNRELLGLRRLLSELDVSDESIERYRNLTEEISRASMGESAPLTLDRVFNWRQKMKDLFISILNDEQLKYPGIYLRQGGPPLASEYVFRRNLVREQGHLVPIVEYLFHLNLIGDEIDPSAIRDFVGVFTNFYTRVLTDVMPNHLDLFQPGLMHLSAPDRHFLLGAQPSADDFLRAITYNLRGYPTFFGSHSGEIFVRGAHLVSEIRDADGERTGYYLSISRGAFEFATGLQFSIWQGNPAQTSLPNNVHYPMATVGLHFGPEGTLRIVNLQGISRNWLGDVPTIVSIAALRMEGSRTDDLRAFLDAAAIVRRQRWDDLAYGLPKDPVSGRPDLDAIREAERKYLTDEDIKLTVALGGLSGLDALLTLTILLAKSKGYRRLEIIRNDAQQARLDAESMGDKPALSYDNFARRFGIGPDDPAHDEYGAIDLDLLAIYQGRTRAGSLRARKEVASLHEYFASVLPRETRGREATGKKWDRVEADPEHPRMQALLAILAPALMGLQLESTRSDAMGVPADPEFHFVTVDQLREVLAP